MADGVDGEATRLEEPPEHADPEVHVVSRHVEVKPRAAAHRRLQAIEVRDRDHQKPARPQDRVGLGEGGARIGQMLEDVPDDDGVERGIGVRALLEGSDVHR